MTNPKIASGWEIDNTSITATNNVLSAAGSSPLTTKGDIFTYSSTNAALAVGSNQQILVADSSHATGQRWDYSSRAKKTTALTYASTTTTDASTGDIFTLTLAGNTILANPSSAVNGQNIIWRIKQSSGGSNSITLDTKFVIPSSATTPLPFSTAPNAMDILAVEYDSGADKFYVVSMIPGY